MTDYLGDKSFEELGLVLLQGYDHPIPGTRDNKLVIPGKHGTYDFGATLDSRYFSLPVVLQENDRESVQAAIRNLTAHLLDAKGKPKVLKLILDEEPEKYYWVKYSGSISIQRIVSVGIFTLPLVADDPYAYASQDYKPSNVITSAEYGTDFEIPDDVNFFGEVPVYNYPNITEFEWNQAIHHVGLYNYSPFTTALNLEIVGKVHETKITNQTTGQTIYLPFINQQTMTIDGEEWDVLIDGEHTFIQVSGDFLELAPGKNELVFEGVSPDAIVSFTWKHKFM